MQLLIFWTDWLIWKMTPKIAPHSSHLYVKQYVWFYCGSVIMYKKKRRQLQKNKTWCSWNVAGSLVTLLHLNPQTHPSVMTQPNTLLWSPVQFSGRPVRSENTERETARETRGNQVIWNAKNSRPHNHFFHFQTRLRPQPALNRVTSLETTGLHTAPSAATERSNTTFFSHLQ